jgi:uncharacterized linocin/CFP29 family protein
MENVAVTQSGREIWAGSSGKWAGEQWLKAMKAGKGITAAALRVADTLRKDEWKAFDEALVEEATIRLRGVGDLLNANLTISVANGLGKTMLEYEKVTDMNPAEVSMDGVVRSENDRQEFTLDSIPLPITHKDFTINLRTLSASRERGESLDTTQVRTAGRLIAEETERMLFQGGKVFQGKTIYGYTTHPNRNTVGFGGAEAWSATGKSGEEVLVDLLTLIGMAETDRMFGPYWLYVSRNASTKLEEDFKANSDKTIRQRLMEVDGVRAIQTVDQLPADNVVLVQATRDVVVMVNGLNLQTVQWDIEGGFRINFKGFQIMLPLIRADAQGRSGVQHMS